MAWDIYNLACCFSASFALRFSSLSRLPLTALPTLLPFALPSLSLTQSPTSHNASNLRLSSLSPPSHPSSAPLPASGGAGKKLDGMPEW